MGSAGIGTLDLLHPKQEYYPNITYYERMKVGEKTIPKNLWQNIALLKKNICSHL